MSTPAIIICAVLTYLTILCYGIHKLRKAMREREEDIEKKADDIIEP